MYFLDADICIEFMRGRIPEGYSLLQRSDPSIFAIPSVVVGELMTGALKSNDPKSNRFLLDCFLAPFQVVAFDEKSAEKYAQVRAYLESKGLKIGPKDAQIAAMALVHSAVLITNNVRGFKRVPGLQVESWQVSTL